MSKFHQAIIGKDTISVVAEIKRRSPSHGDFPHHDVSTFVAMYEQGGASALSCVTEPTKFGGSLALLREMRGHTRLPILRKDFLTDTRHIEETKECGASAVLLIAAILDAEQLQNLVSYAIQCGLDPVVEIHDEEDVTKIQGLENIIIGINNRNLKTFRTDVNHARQLLDKIPGGNTLLIESGFQKPEELLPYQGYVDAVLIGGSLLTSPSPLTTLQSFTHVSRT